MLHIINVIIALLDTIYIIVGTCQFVNFFYLCIKVCVYANTTLARLSKGVKMEQNKNSKATNKTTNKSSNQANNPTKNKANTKNCGKGCECKEK